MPCIQWVNKAIYKWLISAEKNVKFRWNQINVWSLNMQILYLPANDERLEWIKNVHLYMYVYVIYLGIKET